MLSFLTFVVAFLIHAPRNSIISSDFVEKMEASWACACKFSWIISTSIVDRRLAALSKSSFLDYKSKVIWQNLIYEFFLCGRK